MHGGHQVRQDTRCGFTFLQSTHMHMHTNTNTHTPFSQSFWSVMLQLKARGNLRLHWWVQRGTGHTRHTMYTNSSDITGNCWKSELPLWRMSETHRNSDWTLTATLTDKTGSTNCFTTVYFYYSAETRVSRGKIIPLITTTVDSPFTWANECHIRQPCIQR